MLQLWDVHVALTREVVLAAALKTPNLNAAVAALYQNQKDLGANLAQFYGKAVGDKYAALLTIHIDLAIKIVTDVLSGLDPKCDIKAWYKNAREIACFLAKTIRFAKFEVLKELLDSHLDCTLDEATLIIQAKYPESLVEFATCLRRIKRLSKYLSKTILASI